MTRDATLLARARRERRAAAAATLRTMRRNRDSAFALTSTQRALHAEARAFLAAFKAREAIRAYGDAHVLRLIERSR